MKHFYHYLACLALMLAGCDPGDGTKADAGWDYFPLAVGHYQIYQVDSTGYSVVAGEVSARYQIMVEITDAFQNDAGTTTFVLSRSYRSDESDSWQYMSTWSVRVENRYLVVSEENTAFVKLAFPVRSGLSWNGNLYNTGDEDDYRILTVDQPFVTSSGTTFERALVVEHEFNDDPIVFQDIRSEVYARGVGLIAREINQLAYCTADNCLGQQIIESGMVYKQEIVEYGQR